MRDERVVGSNRFSESGMFVEIENITGSGCDLDPDVLYFVKAKL